MTRYIDVEIAKYKVDEMDSKWGRDDLESEGSSLVEKYDVIDLLDEIQTEDVQPVVHCKNCFWYNKKTNCCTFLGNEQFDEDEYCSKYNEIQGNIDGDEHD